MPTNLIDNSLEVHELLVKIINDDLPSNETDLIETGLLDSLALVSLIMELENHFSVNIDFDALELESFRSVAAITDYIQRLSG